MLHRYDLCFLNKTTINVCFSVPSYKSYKQATAVESFL